MGEKQLLPEKLKPENLPFQEMWDNRGNNTKRAIAVALPPEWKSDYGLGLYIACKERELTFDGYAERKKSYCIAIFEKRPWHKEPDDMFPIGFLAAEEIRDNPEKADSQTHIVSYNDQPLTSGQLVIIDNPSSKDDFEVDPLFDKVRSNAFDAQKRKHSQQNAFSVGFNLTKAAVRNLVLDRLLAEGKIEQADHNTMKIIDDDHRSIWRKYINTGNNVGDLLLQSLEFAAVKLGYDKLYLVAHNKLTKNVVDRSGIKYKSIKSGRLLAYQDDPDLPTLEITLSP